MLSNYLFVKILEHCHQLDLTERYRYISPMTAVILFRKYFNKDNIIRCMFLTKGIQ
jgi:hypothetical protein